MKCSFFLVLFLLISEAVFGAFLPPNEARIDEIAAWLPEKPAPLHPDFRPSGRTTGRKRAREVRATPVPAFDLEAYNEFWTTGNRTHFQKWRGQFLGDLNLLIDLETSERKGLFLQAIADRLEAVCTWPSWTLNAHDRRREAIDKGKPVVGLTSSALARRLAETLVLLGDRLPTGTVARVRGEIDSRVLRPYLEFAARTAPAKKCPSFSWFFGRNNWNAVCHCECVCAALAIVSDRRTRARFIEAAERAMPSYLAGFASDGYCSEGMGYWNYGFGHFQALGLAVRTATDGKVDFFADPKAKAAMRYAFAYQLQKNRSPRFADGGGNPVRNFLERGCQIWPDLRTECEGVLPPRSAFPDGQVWLLRAADEKGRPLAIACKGGNNNECHNHNDVGSYTIMLDGTFVTGDPGGEVYTRRTFSKDRYQSNVLNSFGHPVPRVGGQLQPKGEAYSARIVRTAFSNEVDEVTLDLTAAYACPTLTSLVRTFRLDRTACRIEIVDRVKFSEPTAFDDPVVNEDLPGQLLPEVRVTGGTWVWKTDRIVNPDRPDVLRRSVTFTEPVREAEVVFTFVVRVGAAEPEG